MWPFPMAKLVIISYPWKLCRALFLMERHVSTTNEWFVVGGCFVFFFSLFSFKKCTLILLKVLISVLNLLWLFCFFSSLFSFKKCTLIFLVVLISVLNLLVSNFFSSSFYKSFVCIEFSHSITICYILFFSIQSLFFSLILLLTFYFQFYPSIKDFFLIWSSFFFIFLFFC